MRQEGDKRRIMRQEEIIGENHETKETESIKRLFKDIKNHKTTTSSQREEKALGGNPWALVGILTNNNKAIT